MGRPTSGEKLSSWARRLVLASCLASVATSILYILFAVVPIAYFRGYVAGYYSLYDYRLYYSYSGEPIPMPHTDYSRHVVAVFSMASYALAGLAVLAVALARWRPLAAPGVSYGVSSALVVLYGLLRGYIWRAIELDIARFGHVAGGTLVYRTLAGVIEFEGAKIEYTAIYRLVLLSPVPLVLLAVAATSSAIAAGIAVYTFYKQTQQPGVPGLGTQAKKLRGIAAYTTIGLTTFALLASLFTYYPSSIAVAPQPPPATLEAPLYPYTCTAITRTARGAIAYTDFEVYPVPGWASYGGSWSSVGGGTGTKGNTLQGIDDGRGLGGASHYYYNTDLSGYDSLWVIAKTRYGSGGKVYYGASMMNSDKNRLFTVRIYRFSAVIGYLEIWSYGVTGTGWVQHAQATISGYRQESWYIIAINYSISITSIVITAYLYGADGSYITSVSTTITHTNVFNPAFIGVHIDDGTAYFDDFIVSAVDPRGVVFTNLQAGMFIEVWDDLGNLVTSGTATTTTLSLSVIHDVVVGTGVDGRVVVRFHDGSLCVDYRVPSTDVILGGDTYKVEYVASMDVALGPNKTSARVVVVIPSSESEVVTAFLRLNTSQTLYARLILDSISAPETLNLDLWLEGAARSMSIMIRGGVVISRETSVVQLILGLNNFIALSGYFTAVGQSAFLSLRLELCTTPSGGGACVYYPITLAIGS